MNAFGDAYTALGLGPEATAEEIEAAYRRAVRRFPPELNPRRFARVQQAYEQLTSYELRMRMAEKSPHQAIDLLYPPVRLTLAEPPTPPTPLQPEDWEPYLQPLREHAVKAILQKLIKVQKG